MTPSPLEEVRAAVCKAVPEQFANKNPEIHLADILLALAKKQDNPGSEFSVFVWKQGHCLINHQERWYRSAWTNDLDWNLSKPLDGQSESCILFLHGVLCGNK